VRLQTNPDTSVLRPEFHQSGRLNKLHVRLNGDAAETDFVAGIAYNPKGQRESIAYGNGTTTAYTYEPETFRLKTLVTTRTGDAKVLQDIGYVYDPVGNIVKIRDDSHNRVFTGGGPVEPVMAFTYDALYRLSEATGRTHNALNGGEYKDPTAFKQSKWAALNDLGQLSLYTEQYAYDDNGNLCQLAHYGTNNFTRDIVVHNASNRALLETDTFEPDPAADWVAAGYFDANGNQTKFDHLAGAAWSYRDNLASATIIDRPSGNDDAEYYVYDAAGQRTRKVKETFESGETVKRVVEKIYLGGVEVKRIKTVDMGTLVETRILARSDLHVMDDKSRIAIVPRWTQDDLLTEIESTLWLDTNRIRYQYGNHLGSASLELDASGQTISYEEYFPYGGTAFISGSSQAEVKLKEYRFTGKERDDTTSFYYYGARYYAPWIGRWLSADPAGPVDGLNLYVYVSDNPISKNDPEGTQEDDPAKSETPKPKTDRTDFLTNSPARLDVGNLEVGRQQRVAQTAEEAQGVLSMCAVSMTACLAIGKKISPEAMAKLAQQKAAVKEIEERSDKISADRGGKRIPSPTSLAGHSPR
jgi:RHS repeat-associated protein